MTDTELRSLLQRSEQAGHTAVFREYFGYVYSIVYSYLRSIASREDVEECVSDVFADVFRSYDCAGNYSGDLKGFIASIARRRAIDRFRSLSRTAGRTTALEELGDLPDQTDLPAHAERAEEGRLLLQCIRELGEPDTTIVLRHCYYDCPAAEIGAALGLSPAAVRMRLSRALRKLRKRLTDLGIRP